MPECRTFSLSQLLSPYKESVFRGPDIESNKMAPQRVDLDISKIGTCIGSAVQNLQEAHEPQRGYGITLKLNHRSKVLDAQPSGRNSRSSTKAFSELLRDRECNPDIFELCDKHVPLVVKGLQLQTHRILRFLQIRLSQIWKARSTNKTFRDFVNSLSDLLAGRTAHPARPNY